MEPAPSAMDTGGQSQLEAISQLQAQLAARTSELEQAQASLAHQSQPLPWSDAEHDAFKRALEAHGGGGADIETAWNHISAVVGTRSVEEVKLHAHGYFFKLQNERAIVSATHISAANAGKAVGGFGELDETWSSEDAATFEQGLAAFDEALADRGSKLQSLLPHKTEEDIRKRYQKLLSQITSIEQGAVPIYTDNEFYVRWCDPEQGIGNVDAVSAHDTVGIPWSEEEHRLFLVGVNKFGRDDVDSISKYYVVTRSADQVAQFGFKYFARIDGARRERMRPPPLTLQFNSERAPTDLDPRVNLSPSESALAAAAALAAANANESRAPMATESGRAGGGAAGGGGVPPPLELPSSSPPSAGLPFTPSGLLNVPSPGKLSEPAWPYSPSLNLPALSEIVSPQDFTFPLGESGFPSGAWAADS